MHYLTINKIIELTNGVLINGDTTKNINSFSKDTRNLKKGDMYLGIKGEKFDGNTYYKDAFEKGAIGCILEENSVQKENLKEYSNIILVENTVSAIQKIASFKREQYNIPVVAVTGSVGKTSTKDMIASVLSKQYNVLKTEENNNNHIGLPLTILKLKEHTALVVEMGMNHFGEISILSKIAQPSICVITNIGTSHIGNLGSRVNILKAKLEILEGMQENGLVIINNDNDLLYKWAQENNNKYNIKTYGIEHKSDYMAYNIEKNENNSKYTVKLENIEKTIEVPIPGIPFIYNSLCGIVVGNELEEKIDSIAQGILEIELTKKRMEILKTNLGITIINDSYNASLDSVKPALEQLKIVTGNKKIAVLGNMLELGEYEKQLHEAVGEEVVNNKIDILITVGNLAINIAKKAIELGMDENKIFSFKNIDDAIHKLKQIQQCGDVILLKASNAMNFNKIAEIIRRSSK